MDLGYKPEMPMPVEVNKTEKYYPELRLEGEQAAEFVKMFGVKMGDKCCADIEFEVSSMGVHKGPNYSSQHVCIKVMSIEKDEDECEGGKGAKTGFDDMISTLIKSA